MNGKQRKTLEIVFRELAAANLPWSDVESLLLALGCRLIEGYGSRVRFELQGVAATFHRPHPQKEAKRYQVRDAREYLTKLGVHP